MNRRLAAILLLIPLILANPAFAQATSGDRADDLIYDQVRLKLANHPDVKGGAIEVEVEQGVVTLKGDVRTEKARGKAESVAGKVKGVKKVVNELRVNPT